MSGGPEYCAKLFSKDGCEEIKHPTKIKVYMQDGRIFEYEVSAPQKAREHCHRIINYGWRCDEEKDLVYYPVHQINKVVICGGAKVAYYRTAPKA